MSQRSIKNVVYDFNFTIIDHNVSCTVLLLATNAVKYALNYLSPDRIYHQQSTGCMQLRRFARRLRAIENLNSLEAFDFPPG